MRTTVFLPVLAAALLLSACSSRVPPEEAIARGQQALADGRWAEAAKLLEDAAAGRPDDATILYNLGTAHLMAGNAAEAAKAFQRSAEKGPQSPDDTSALESLAEARRRAGDPEGAAAAFNRAIQLAGRRPYLLAGLAACKMDRAYLGEAKPLLEEAMAADDPKNPEPVVLFNDAVIHTTPTYLDVPRAADSFARFVTITTDRDEYASQRADAIRRVRDLRRLRSPELVAKTDKLLLLSFNPDTPPADRLNAAKEAVNLDPSNPAALAIVARLADEQGNAELAEKARRYGRTFFPEEAAFAKAGTRP